MSTEDEGSTQMPTEVDVIGRGRAVAAVVLVAALLAAIRIAFPERSLDYLGPLALLDQFFAIGLLVVILLVASGLGVKVLGLFQAQGLTHLEKAVFAAPIGLGILGYGMLTLGLIGFFNPYGISLWCIAATALAAKECVRIVEAIPTSVRGLAGAWRGLSAPERGIAVAACAFLVLALPQCLLPPLDYDGLMYHLQAPRLFLQSGRIVLLPDVWTGNYPLTLEMVGAIGLMLDSASLLKLLHLALGVYLALATFCFGKRFLGRFEAWLALALLLGSPVLSSEATGGFVDLGWALYEFLALYCIAIWSLERHRRWLILSGMLVGLALGTKYIAIIHAGVLALWVLLESRRQGRRRVTSDLAVYVSGALGVGIPWYAKNWVMGGNPVYPLFFGGTEWPPERLTWLTEFLGSFGTGRGLSDYALLPWNLFAHSTEFGPPQSILDTPNPLFLFAIAYPLVRRRGVLDMLAAFVAIRLVAWSLSTQVVRYLLPLFPVLSVIIAAEVAALTRRTRVSSTWLAGVALPPIAITVAYLTIYTIGLGAFQVSVGLESKRDFLRHHVAPFRLHEIVTERLLPTDRVLLMWDARGFYRDMRYIVDAEQSHWSQLVNADASVDAVVRQLRSRGVTHMILSVPDVLFMTESHDPANRHTAAADFFWEKFAPTCARELYSDREAYLFELTCP